MPGCVLLQKHVRLPKNFQNFIVKQLPPATLLSSLLSKLKFFFEIVHHVVQLTICCHGVATFHNIMEYVAVQKKSIVAYKL